MRHPLLYELNTRHWLAELSRRYGRPIDLFGVPEDDLDFFEERGFTHLWLMGVWPTGPRSRDEALKHPDLRTAYELALAGWTDDDVLGSPYAVGALHVSPLLGGDAGLVQLRERLAERDIKLILDFVPNHLGLDHAWVLGRPELFVSHASQIPDAFVLRTPTGLRWIAHGKDPYFPGWTDTAQLDYRKQETRAAVAELIQSVSDKCDGVRCDMAMLVLNDVFHRTWSHVPIDVDAAAGEFWHDAIARTKEHRGGEFTFLAEAYWDLEERLCDLGFDYAYDKKLYDLVVHDHAWQVQPHLLGLGDANARRAHFLENHDEPRIRHLLDLDRHRAAALLVLGLPGMRFLHEGQLEGLTRFARVQLARRAVEPPNEEIRALYDRVLAAVKDTAVGNGTGRLLAPKRAWEDNPTAQCMTLVQWQQEDRDDHFELVVVNHAPHAAQCRAPLDARGLSPGTWALVDRLGNERWTRDGKEMARDGLWLDVGAHATQLFSFQRA
jgi:hypothetical protein